MTPNKELRERIATILLREFGIGTGKVSMLNIAEEILALLPQPEEKEFNPQSMDAVVWAKEFMRVYNSPKAGVQLLDEDSMRSWFANAIMAGYDEAKRRYDKPQPEVMGEEDILEIVIDKAGYMYPNECRAISHALANKISKSDNTITIIEFVEACGGLKKLKERLGKIPMENGCECGQAWGNHDNRKCNKSTAYEGTSIKQSAKVELPEELNINDIHAFNPSPEINENLIFRGENSIGVVVNKFNQIIKYLRERE